MVDVAINGRSAQGGLAQTDHYRNESDVLPRAEDARRLARSLEFDSGGHEGAEDDLTVVIQENAEEPVEQIGIERADGALIIRLDGKPYTREPKQGAKEHDANLNSKFKFSNLAAWVKTAESSPIVYIQMGHDRVAWENPAFRTLLDNAVRWAASKDAMAWAKKNPTKIFKGRASTN